MSPKFPLLAAAAGLCLGACAEDELFSVGTVTDVFTQNTAASTDVLWVVDNSESMAEEQTALGLSFESFIANLTASQVDYHIGVASTDTADGGQLHQPSGEAYISPSTANATDAFLQNAQVGTAGSRSERAFEVAALALGVGGAWAPGDAVTPPNPGFLRDSASLFLIMVSDENDKSFGPITYYERLFEGYKGPGFEKRISVSAIVGPEPDGCETPGGRAEPGTRYAELARRSGGLTVSICDAFADSLRDLSITAARLATTFTLSQNPNENGFVQECSGGGQGFCVRVDGSIVPEDGYSFDAGNNAIVFATGSIPPPQAEITVEYQVGR